LPSRFGRFFVLRDAGGIRHLGKFQGLNPGDMAGEVRVSIRECLQRLPYGVVGIEHGLYSQIHGQLVLLLGIHSTSSVNPLDGLSHQILPFSWRNL
jgi:hypothetical protein